MMILRLTAGQQFMMEKYRARILKIGTLTLGGSLPVRIQSMANASTMDAEAVMRQARSLSEAGCEMLRLAVKNMKEVDQLAVIRSRMEKEGITMPLVADIHFNPALAEAAAALVHKVRINPGNYLDQQYFLSKERKTTPLSLSTEERTEGILRLTGICRRHNTVIRVGVNHGSLSGRILQQYGNTVSGMVISAMEFLRICQSDGFHDLVVSMKSSHVPTMVSATRAIAEAMTLEGMDYPIHLGVTEAGAGRDGRIRSAAGIGPLLAEGLGDTIRVSLTEDPVKEIPVAGKLVSFYTAERRLGQTWPAAPAEGEAYHSRYTKVSGIVGGDRPPAVVGQWAADENDLKPDLWPVKANMLADSKGESYILQETDGLEAPENIPADGVTGSNKLLLVTGEAGNLAQVHKLFTLLGKQGCRLPVVARLRYDEADEDAFILRSAADLSSLILKGFGNAYWVEDKQGRRENLHRQVFDVLQATAARITGTEYISCPTCGRTSFDIERTLSLIKKHTAGLTNVRIAVMGCIVNGPGEMAEADYGYVGAGKGKITLYHRGKVVRKNIPEQDALDELLSLIERTRPD